MPYQHILSQRKWTRKSTLCRSACGPAPADSGGGISRATLAADWSCRAQTWSAVRRLRRHPPTAAVTHSFASALASCGWGRRRRTSQPMKGNASIWQECPLRTGGISWGGGSLMFICHPGEVHVQDIACEMLKRAHTQCVVAEKPQMVRSTQPVRSRDPERRQGAALSTSF